MTFYFNEYRQRVEHRDDVAAAFHFRVLGNESDFSFNKALRYIYSKLDRSFNLSVAVTVLLRKQANEPGGSDEWMVFFGQVCDDFMIMILHRLPRFSCNRTTVEA